MTSASSPKTSAGDGQASLKYRRIIAKAGTNLLTGGAGKLDLERMAALVGQLATLHHQGADVMLVTSGAVAAGREALAANANRPSPKDAPSRQALAAIGQSRLMHAYANLFEQAGVPVAQALLTRRDIADRVGYLNIRNTILNLLTQRAVPIVNENDVVAAEELEGDTFGDNDTLSAMVANIVDADLLIILSDVGGLYTADPHKDPTATLIPRVERIDSSIDSKAGGAISAASRGGMTTKIEAARLATASGVAVVICDGRTPDVLTRVASGEQIGTLFPAITSKLERRERWMLSICSKDCGIMVDAGAETALRTQNRSLLPAGIKRVQGQFDRGEVVPVLNDAGQRIAVGIANYGSVDLRKVAGKRSDQARAVLGETYGDEAVHRNNMVVL
ncbi:MAG: glutamate 5-kinase [Dehalococcoidia bacterium]|nr:glutamate 5-kinase [Dehalococcoidia bacterium]